MSHLPQSPTSPTNRQCRRRAECQHRNRATPGKTWRQWADLGQRTLVGSDVRYVGALGTPDVHSLFVDLAHATHAVSLANPAGPWHSVCVKPRVFTGAGDHFNAGYLFGRNAGLLPPEAIRAGALVATAYVTNGFSPDADCLTLDVP